MFQCSPCGKTFTGRVCYDQHMISEKHKRKVLSLSFLKNENNASMNLSNKITATEPKCDMIIKCHVCDISFNSVESFQSHSVTPEHALKIMLNKTEDSLVCNIVSSSSKLSNNQEPNDNGDETRSIDEDEMILPGFNDHKKSQYQSYGSCDICRKTFSGPEPYRQHIESTAHKKKVELQNNPPVSGINLNVSAFSCETCKKVFSGQVPYIQHMNSEPHKKKLQHLQDVQKYVSEVDSSPRMEENIMREEESENNNPWFCKACNVQCSGLVPYQQHLGGSTHFKNTKRLQLPQNSFKAEDSLKLVMPENNYNESRISETSDNVFQLVNNSKQKDVQKMEEDYILPEMIQRLNVMSTDELEESIKIFYPDEKIDFDKCENKMHIDSVNENVNHDDSQQNNGEVKEKSENSQECNGNVLSDVAEIDIDGTKGKPGVYQVCNLCNVKLFDKDEAACHFESVEHFNKRWRSN